MKTKTALMVAAFLCCLFGPLLNPTPAQAAFTTTTMYNTLDHTVTKSTTADVWVHQYNIGFGPPHSPSGMTAVRYVKGRVLVNSTAPSIRARAVLYSWEQEGSLYSTLYPYGGNPCTLVNTSTKGAWVPFEVALPENQNSGDTKLALGVTTGSGYTATARFIIEEVRYETHFFDPVTISITPDKYVKIDLAISPNRLYKSIQIHNVTDNRTIMSSNNVSSDSISVTDVGVIPEKTYTYRILTGFGIWSGVQTEKTLSIKVPSDATHAWEAAESARAAVIYSAPGDPDHGKTAAILAKDAKDAATAALNAVSALQASVGPQLHKVQGLNGATATTSSSFSVVVDASGATEFRARREGGTWTGWASVGNSLSVSGLTVGANTIQVEVRNASGATATGRMVAFRL